MALEISSRINQLINAGGNREKLPIKEEWQRHSPKNVETFLQALKSGYGLIKYNEHAGNGKYLTVLAKGRGSKDKIELELEDYAWAPMIYTGSKSYQKKLIAYLEKLQMEMGQNKKTLPEHLL